MCAHRRKRNLQGLDEFPCRWCQPVGMARHLGIRVLLVYTSLMLAAAGEAAEDKAPSPRPLADYFSLPGQTNYIFRGQTNGDWAAWIESRLVGSPHARALRFEEKLYRRGPTNIA